MKQPYEQVDADSAAERALLDYFDDLLRDPAREPDSAFRAAATANAVAANTAPAVTTSSNVTPLASAPRPVRAVPARPYAEPVTTLNLRLPLPPAAPVEAAAAIEPAPAAPVEVAPTPVVPAETVAAIAPATAPAEQPAVRSAAAEIEADTREMQPPQPWPDNGRPAWAQQSFESLLFKVGGLALAVPLVELGSIYLLEDGNLTPIFGQAEWFMGLLPAKECNYRIIDTAKVVMPERYQESMREGYRYVITLNGSDWGLAVDQVANAVRLDPEQVRWRGQRSQRPWLAGTVVEHMCALLDAAQLAWMFHNQDRKRRSRRPV